MNKKRMIYLNILLLKNVVMHEAKGHFIRKVFPANFGNQKPKTNVINSLRLSSEDKYPFI